MRIVALQRMAVVEGLDARHDRRAVGIAVLEQSDARAEPALREVGIRSIRGVGRLAKRRAVELVDLPDRARAHQGQQGGDPEELEV